jgi:hypothetical protein
LSKLKNHVVFAQYTKLFLESGLHFLGRSLWLKTLVTGSKSPIFVKKLGKKSVNVTNIGGYLFIEAKTYNKLFYVFIFLDFFRANP